MTRSRSEAEQKKLADDARLMRAWRRWHHEELAEALAGPYGPMVERLAFMLKTLELASSPLLLAYIRGVDWATVDYRTRLTVLHEVNSAITRLRERNGMDPFDDGVPGERDNVFRIIRGIVTSYASD
jgi:hypothetical protein